MEWLLDPQAWVALATLTALETVLGIDNVISILAGRLPLEQRSTAQGREPTWPCWRYGSDFRTSS